ncbi:MAG: glycosyltransferase [Synechocystis sp.]
MAEAIKKHLNLSEAEQEQLSQQARQFVLEHYTWDNIAQQLFTVYRCSLGQRPKPD